MAFTITVVDCEGKVSGDGCPFCMYQYRGLSTRPIKRCRMEMRVIRKKKGELIPKWCPLDKKEKLKEKE